MKRSRKRIEVRKHWFTFADDKEYPWKNHIPKHLRGKAVHRFRWRNKRYFAKCSPITAIDWILKDVYRDKDGRPPSLAGVFKW